MGKRGDASERRLDELYREPPEKFVAMRNELVKDLRAAGDRAAAERLKRLRRPTPAAWLLNRVALDSPELLQEFAATTGAVQDAQARVLNGEEAASEWRNAAAREHDASAAIREAAERTVSAAGRPASPRALELVVETLRAAADDRELRDRIMSGRLEREQQAASLGLPGAAQLPAHGKAKAAKGRDDAKPRRDRQRLDAALDDALSREERLRRQVEETTEALRREKAKLADAKRETTALKRKLKTVE